MNRLAIGVTLVAAASLLGLRALSAPATPAAAPPGPSTAPVPTVRPRVVASYPHDPTAFTQGLVVHDGELLESTGTYGGSSIRAEDLRTGQVRTRAMLDPRYFGEGTTVLGDKIYVLTWREHVCFVYSLAFLKVATFPIEGEGWGLTNDGTNLIMSDGTTSLRYLDPATLNVVRTLHVHDAGADIVNLNELELIRGEIWANVWQTDRIVRIAPGSGDVVGELDLHAIDGGWSKGEPDAVLNGIAYDTVHDRIYVTGKLWPKLFEISLPR